MIQSSHPKKEESQKKSMAGALKAIWKIEGPLGFFKGLKAQILKTVLSSALLLMIKEKLSRNTWILIVALSRYFFLSQNRLKVNI